MTMRTTSRRLALLSILATVALAAPARAATVVGTGRSPNVSVDPAGTAYVVWNGLENVRTLHFCRVPRGAAACDAATTIATPGTTESRPFVTVSGARVVVVEHRYGGDVPGFFATYASTSQDGGMTFGAARVIGRIPFDDTVLGPGDTISGVPNAKTEGTVFQNSPLDGAAPVDPDGKSTVGSANLSADHPYTGAVGLLDAGTPLAVFAGLDSAYQFRRYTGSGSLNDVGNWTTAVDFGKYQNAKLLGGPSGLFLIAVTPQGIVVARKWAGASFGPPATIGPGDWPTIHGVQDAAGRLHVVFRRSDSDGLHLIHAVSDNGANWRQGNAASQTVAADGDLAYPRIAVAPDHIGRVVWTATSANEIRIATIGPGAPVDFSAPSTEGFANPRVARAGGALAIVSGSQSLRTLKTKGLAVRLQSVKAGKVTLTVAGRRPGHPPAPIRTLTSTFTAPGVKDVRIRLSAVVFKRATVIVQRGMRLTLTVRGKSSAVNLNLRR